MRGAYAWIACAAMTLWIGGCGPAPTGPSTDSGSHWLSSCVEDSDCGEAMACACGVCTPVCDATYACGGLGATVECVSPRAQGIDDLCGERPPSAVCLPSCAEDADCGDDDLACVAGHCGPAPLAVCGDAPLDDAPACFGGELPGTLCTREADGTYTHAWETCADTRVGCYGDDGCGDGMMCNVDEVCLADPGCPECDVCYGWCVVDTGVSCEDDGACDLGEVCEDGRCEAVPCPDLWEPVCGEGEVTFANACEARASHVDVIYEGECGMGECEPESCGPDPIVDPCPGGFERLVECLPDGEGVCRWHVASCEAVVCPELYEPVCGEDGVTYDNACFLEAALTGLAYEGECECGPEDCDAAFAASVCEDGTTPGTVCEPQADGRCGWSAETCPGQAPCAVDAECPVGMICEARVCQESLCPAVWDPVCGVDEATYANACEARAAHVEVAVFGACEGF